MLFICSGNSARSIFAEALLKDIGQGRFHPHSAGTQPGTQLNPFAIEVLARAGHDGSTLRSKHVSEFETADAPKMDFVFTVCDQAAAEECAPLPGQPMTVHWGLPDPVKATSTDAEKTLAFADVFASLHRRISAFTVLPFAELEKIALQQQLVSLGLEYPHARVARNGRLTQAKRIEDVPLARMAIDLVIDGTGVFKTAVKLAPYYEADVVRMVAASL